ncbi:MAG: 2-isopropylmalate synthase [Synechococcales bacterium]|nr:2-isopropylmalate synthase [Synechococcales bacterium]
MVKSLNLVVSDETLRDGEQQVGLFFNQATKFTLAQLIAQTGVHQIALMPLIHSSEAELTQTLVGQGLGRQVVASTLMSQAAIDYSKACGVQQIILFHAVSDRLMFLRDPALAADPRYQNKTVDDGVPATVIHYLRQQMVEKVLDHLRYAAQQGLRVCFAAEDASRTDFQFLVDCIKTFAPYLEQFLLCDTVGALTPEKTYVWIHDLLELTDHAPLSVHFHNDMGLALENTIQAVLAGATGISGTFGGIGERAGNAPLEQVLHGLRLRFGWEVPHINYGALEQVVDFLHRQGWRPHPPYSQAAQRHESGIHVSSLLRDRHSYAIFPYGQPEIWFGKCSGASNLQYLFEQRLQRPLSRQQYEKLRAQVKAIAIREQRSFSAEEVIDLLTASELEGETNLTDPQ